MLILKQNAANTVPTPPAGKGTIFLNSSDDLAVKTSSGNVELLKNCSIEERLKIVEQLPYQVANGIIDFNRRIEEYINDLLTFEEKTLSFDMSFFE